MNINVETFLNRINWHHPMARFILQRYRMWPHQILHYHYQKLQQSRSKGLKSNRLKRLRQNQPSNSKCSNFQRYRIQRHRQPARVPHKQRQLFEKQRPKQRCSPLNRIKWTQSKRNKTIQLQRQRLSQPQQPIRRPVHQPNRMFPHAKSAIKCSSERSIWHSTWNCIWACDHSNVKSQTVIRRSAERSIWCGTVCHTPAKSNSIVTFATSFSHEKTILTSIKSKLNSKLRFNWGIAHDL